MQNKFPIKREKAVHKPSTINIQKDMADQSFKDECDVNNIMAKYKKTKVWPGEARGFYADLPPANDLMEAYTLIQDTADAFDALPAAARNRFKNDPFQLAAYLQDPSNWDEAISLGLMERNSKHQKKVETPKPDNVPASKEKKEEG